MQIVDKIASLQHVIKEKKGSCSIGLVPTMGALHQGHISLVEACKKENDITICSIFVNPKQFNNPDDLKKYPRNLEADCTMLAAAGCDIVFTPSMEEMYGELPSVVHLSFGYLEQIMEGKFRPGHFYGVGMVVLKLLNIATPDKAYFGQKDLQQFVVIKQLVKELNYPVQLRCMPVVREIDGLAMSSRNIRLGVEARKHAVIFSRAIREAEKMVQEKQTAEYIKQQVVQLFDSHPAANLEYFEIVNSQTLIAEANPRKGNTALCIAGYVDGIRLIDNIIV